MPGTPIIEPLRGSFIIKNVVGEKNKLGLKGLSPEDVGEWIS
jgi:hypothetical protein